MFKSKKKREAEQAVIQAWQAKLDAFQSQYDAAMQKQDPAVRVLELGALNNSIYSFIQMEEAKCKYKKVELEQKRYLGVSLGVLALATTVTVLTFNPLFMAAGFAGIPSGILAAETATSRVGKKFESGFQAIRTSCQMLSDQSKAEANRTIAAEMAGIVQSPAAQDVLGFYPSIRQDFIAAIRQDAAQKSSPALPPAKNTDGNGFHL